MPEQHPTNAILLAFDPQLGLEPDDFIRLWNLDPACRQSAHAEAGRLQGQDFSLGGLEIAVLTVAGGLLTGLATNALYDLIKLQLEKLLADRSPQLGPTRRRITWIETQTPDGAPLRIVTFEEES